MIKIFKKNSFEIIFFGILFLFSIFLMLSTFGYSNGNIIIAGKAWSDFGSHIPLIRSFSFGNNFPPEYPLFANEPIRYHFIFYSIVGALEKFGLRLDYALNIPSVLGFFSLLVVIYFFSFKLFHSKLTSFLSVIFFLFNGSLSFLYFFKIHPLNGSILYIITTNSSFVSFHPYYGDNLISAFWNLNIYTNQRHLAAAFAFSLFIIYCFLYPVFKNTKKYSILLTIILGLTLGLSYFFHLAAFTTTAVVIFILSIFFPKIRNQGFLILLITAIVAYPQYKYMNASSNTFTILFKPGYLIFDKLTLLSFLNYWSLNLGLHLLLMPIGFILSSKRNKKIFISFFSFFVIGNIFQFSSEIAANHKFFNYFILIGNMFSAYVIFLLWKRNYFLKLISILLTFFIILSGIIDLFPIFNDPKIEIPDYPRNPDIVWIMKNTAPNSIFLNTSYFLSTESLAGRKVYLGWPYFAWSQGYNTYGRSNELSELYHNTNKYDLCNFLINNSVSYISVNLNSKDYDFNKDYFRNNFVPTYKSQTSDLEIYSTSKLCK